MNDQNGRLVDSLRKWLFQFCSIAFSLSVLTSCLPLHSQNGGQTITIREDILYQENFADGPGGWYSHNFYAPWIDFGVYRIAEWKREWGYIESRSPWKLDLNHAYPGAGILQLVALVWVNSFNGGLHETTLDLTNTILRFKIMTKDLDLKGGHLYFWFQHEYERGSARKLWKRANFALKQFPIETFLIPNTWSEVTLPITQLDSAWHCLGASPATIHKYGCVPTSDALRDVNVDFGFIILPVDPNNPPSGTICLDDIYIYRLIPRVTRSVGDGNTEENLTLTSRKDRISYGIGMEIGGNLKELSPDINLDLFKKGIKDAFLGGEALLTEQEVRNMIPALFREKINEKSENRVRKLLQKRTEGEAFLIENSKKENVKISPSGLQYEVTKSGTGKKPNLTDTVTIHYRGTLVDGTEFDSSYDRGGPVSFQMADTIPGWIEALQMMEEGAKWKLFIPPSLAFGEYGVSSLNIEPNATLIFEIELISIIDHH